MGIFDIYLLEALINGVLLGGVLALLSLGLNLIFGVIDVVWICYAELVMVGMYGMNYAYKGGVPFVLAAVFAILLVAFSGALLHFLVIRPVLDTPPINQLLVTGGVLFLMQAAATMAFGIEFKNRHVHQLCTPAGVRRRAAGYGAAVLVPGAHLYRHGDPRHLAGPADHAADGCG